MPCCMETCVSVATDKWVRGALAGFDFHNVEICPPALFHNEYSPVLVSNNIGTNPLGFSR